MKAPLALALSVLAILAAVLSFVLVERKNSASSSEMRARLDALSREEVELRSEVAALKAGEISAEQRSAIHKLIADDRAEQKRLQSDDQEKRFSQLTTAFADRTAQKYGLTDDQRKGLFEVLMQSRDRLEAMEAQLIEVRKTGDVDAMTKAANETYSNLKTWRLEELSKRLGQDVAEHVNDEEFGMLGDASRLEASRRSR